jgi:hypothetical protein
MSRRAALLTALALSAAGGCRDGVPPFSPTELAPEDGELVRLTYNAGDERDPRWSAAGDTIYYHTDAWAALPGYRGILLQIPARGGTATRLAPTAQPTATPKLVLPVPSPDGRKLAYLHLRRELTDPDCRLGNEFCPLPAPVLDTGVIRVRNMEALNTTFDDPGITVGYPAGPRSLEAPFLDVVFPFQADYAEVGDVASLRPSWAPDNERLVFSDGTRLLTWRAGDAAPVEIPNTTDGIAPAWSPDGQWIAFGILQRGTPISVTCSCGQESVQRDGWELAARLIAVIRPDGSDLRILTDGSEPAWSADGAMIYFRRLDAGVFRIPLAGGEAVGIANTERARSPAVAADGSALLFARLDPGSVGADFNIWRLRLEP